MFSYYHFWLIFKLAKHTVTAGDDNFSLYLLSASSASYWQNTPLQQVMTTDADVYCVVDFEILAKHTVTAGDDNINLLDMSLFFFDYWQNTPLQQVMTTRTLIYNVAAPSV